MEKRKTKIFTFFNDYVHEPREVSKARLVNQLNLQYQMDLNPQKTIQSNILIKKETLWDGEKPEKITRAMCNMSAAYMSCFFFVSYICTHESNLITLDKNPSEPYHCMYDIPISAFYNIVGADNYEEKNNLLTELKKINGQSKVIDMGDRYAYIPPFEIHFFSKEKKKMNTQEIHRLVNTNHFPVATINIKFLKRLYDRFLIYKNTYSSYPARLPKIVREFCREKPTLNTTPEIIIRALTYLNLHDRYPLPPSKVINVYEMIYYADPGAIKIVPRIIDEKK
jgi:hypothetical protein